MPNWVQQLIVILFVVGAVAWLIRDRRRKRAANAGCDSCALMKAARPEE